MLSDSANLNEYFYRLNLRKIASDNENSHHNCRIHGFEQISNRTWRLIGTCKPGLKFFPNVDLAHCDQNFEGVADD